MNVEHLIFDLDNTLYPSSGNMDKGITQRMMNFVASFFDVSYEEAVKIRAEHIRDFSTTLEWLRSEGLTDVESYFSAVHPPYEADELEENPSLRPFLESIRIPKIILTNAPSEHAERVLEKLRVRDLFTAVCDIRTSGLLGKPYPQAFRSALKKCGGTIENTLFIDDMKKYTDGFAALGGTAVLTGDKIGHALNPKSNAVTKEKPLRQGRTIRIPSVYDLPKLISELSLSD